MRITLVQMKVAADKAENVSHGREMIRRAAKEGTDLVILPEMFCCPYANESFVQNGEPAGGMVWTEMSKAAAENGVYLIAGSMPEREGDKLYNTSFVFDPDGRQLARHRKAYLFDINVPGKQRFYESETFTPGDEVTVFDTPWGRVGLCICFDMRFPELSRDMARRGAFLIAAPAAFNMTTGPAHWELLFRQRATDNQVFTVGVAPARDVNGVYVSYANSILCHPWGDVLQRCGADEELITVEIDPRETEKIRKQLPLLASLRDDLYREDASHYKKCWTK